MGATITESQLLRPRDVAHLQRLGLSSSVTVENSMTCLVLSSYSLPAGLMPATTDLLLRLPAGFPDQAPDMFWCAPAVTRGGTAIPATDHVEAFLGRQWQRWSRHYQAQWRAGIDDLASLLAIVRRCLADAAGVGP